MVATSKDHTGITGARRTHIVPVRMTDAEYTEARASAASLGISLSRLCRSHAKALPPPKADLALAFEVQKIGVNLNQIARAINCGLAPRLGSVMPILYELSAQLTEIRSQLRNQT